MWSWSSCLMISLMPYAAAIEVFLGTWYPLTLGIFSIPNCPLPPNIHEWLWESQLDWVSFIYNFICSLFIFSINFFHLAEAHFVFLIDMLLTCEKGFGDLWKHPREYKIHHFRVKIICAKTSSPSKHLFLCSPICCKKPRY